MEVYINERQIRQAYEYAMQSVVEKWAVVEFQTSNLSISAKYCALPYFEDGSLERHIRTFAQCFIRRPLNDHVTANIISVTEEKESAMKDIERINALKKAMDMEYRKKVARYRHGIITDVRETVN